MKPGEIRIIGGKWRGLHLKVANIKECRPTPDRVRETIFNWLVPYLREARCLDLFAGSGALGFEALSRGAAYVEMVDQALEVIATLKAAAMRLQTTQVQIYQANIPTQLQLPQKPFDIVFLDPPYQANLLFPSCHYLETQGFLADNAFIYLEANQVIEDNDLPGSWHIVKAKQAGQVFYHLAHREKK